MSRIGKKYIAYANVNTRSTARTVQAISYGCRQFPSRAEKSEFCVAMAGFFAQFLGFNWLIFLVSASLLLFCWWGRWYVRYGK